MYLDDLPTPCLLVDAKRLARNLARMQEKAEAAGVRLRPHTKTHKSVLLARRQLDLGAAGITVAKVGEAEVFAAAGFDDIRLAYTIVGEERYERLAKLMEKARISFCVDTLAGARTAAAFFAARGETAEVLIEVDCGYGRCGVRWDDPHAVDFAREVAALPGLRLAGLLTHAGHSYHGPHDGETEEEALRRVSAEERDHLLAFAVRLSEAGIPGVVPGAFEISIGSTPTMRYFEPATRGGFGITEIRPGNYVFNDAIQVRLGVAAWADCALTVLTTVVSRHRDAGGQERLFLDAGKKILTSDTGYRTDGHGQLLYNPRTMEPLPHARIVALSEEHGWVRVTGGATLDVGDRVRVVPNHACVSVHTQDLVYLIDGETVIDTLPVDARSGSF